MTEIVIVVVMIDRALFQKRRYLFNIFLFELMRRCDENIINTFLFKTNFKTLVFLREYRRERSEFDVGPGLKFINIYIKVAIIVKKTRRGALLIGETVHPPPLAFVKLIKIKAMVFPNENSSCSSSFSP